MELLKHTFFINLEERKDRLEHIENELKNAQSMVTIDNELWESNAKLEWIIYKM